MNVPVSGKIYGDLEKRYAHEAVEDGWLTEGRWCAEFEKRLREFIGRREVVLCNSGSSANLLAMLALKEFYGIDWIDTCVTGFPTTLAPILQAGIQPFFTDIDPLTLKGIGASVLG